MHGTFEPEPEVVWDGADHIGTDETLPPEILGWMVLNGINPMAAAAEPVVNVIRYVDGRQFIRWAEVLATGPAKGFGVPSGLHHEWGAAEVVKRRRETPLHVPPPSQSDTCPGGCGQPLSESMDPANERRYKVALPMRCHACTAIADAKSGRHYEHPGTLTWTVTLDRSEATA